MNVTSVFIIHIHTRSVDGGFWFGRGLSSSIITSNINRGQEVKEEKLGEFTRRKITWWKVDWWCNIVILTRLRIFRVIIKTLNLIDVGILVNVKVIMKNQFGIFRIISQIMCLWTHFAIFFQFHFLFVSIFFYFIIRITFSKIGYVVLHLRIWSTYLFGVVLTSDY